MVDVFRHIGLFANGESPVLIVGETGTGKELVARALHKYSNRRDKKFITLLISSLSSNLVESELFGHEKGAFTGADRLHIGRIEAAGDGCLFIDELADMPMDTQAKLLRVLEQGDFSRVGGEETLKNQARLIIATNVSPQKLLDEKRLREDLYFRLDVCRINLPPLRERLEDIPELAEFFIARENTNQKKDIIGVNNDVMEKWQAYNWPGNVRQLQNAINRAVSMTRDRIISEAFIDDAGGKGLEAVVESAIGGPSGGGLPNLKDAVGELENKVIQKALKETKGNLSEAAQLIGLTRRELQGRMEKYEIVQD
jgi:DNA-binding NtrC family response regulator